jgi:hypothetical protein
MLFTSGCVFEWVDFCGTAQNPYTAQIHVAFFLQVCKLKVLEQWDAVVVRIVVVPLESLGVEEDCVVGESIVAVDDVPV